MQNVPLVSIIMPAYNAENTILRALDSLTSQTFRDEIEVIVINDGSKDGTAEVVNNFYNENALNWKLIFQVNSGEAQARNAGLDICTGKYILFLDADDSLHPDALELLVKVAEKNQCDLVFSSYRKVFPENKYRDYKFKRSSYTAGELIKKFFQRRITIGIGNTLIAGDLVHANNVRFKNYRAGTDNHFFRDFLRYVATGISVPEVLFHYRVNSGSVMTAAYSDSRIDSILSVHDTRKTFIEDCASPELLASLDLFLINEIRGNATDYLLSTDNYLNNKSWRYVKDKILVHMPRAVDKRIFFGSRRLAWSLLILIFFYLPRSTLYAYLSLIHLRTSFENLLRGFK